MSLNTKSLVTGCVLPEELDCYGEQCYSVIKGPKDATFNQYTALNFSDTNISWNVNGNDLNTFMSRRVLVSMDFFIHAVGPYDPLYSTNNRLVRIGQYDALRRYPIQNGAVDSINLQLNNANIACSIRELIDPMLHYNTDAFHRSREMGLCPEYPDTVQNYSDVDTVPIADGGGIFVNPLSGYGDSENSCEPHRGAFKYDFLYGYSDPVGLLTHEFYHVSVTEPIFVSPLTTNWSQLALIALRSFKVTLNLNNLTRIWSHSTSGNAISNIYVNLSDNYTQYISANNAAINTYMGTAGTFAVGRFYASGQVLQTQTYTSNLIDLASLPKQIVLDYYSVQRYVNNINSPFAAGELKTNQISSVVQLGSIPKYFMVLARKQQALRQGTGPECFTATDSYAYIPRISVQWNNRATLLSNSTPQALYSLCCKHNYQKTWYDHSQKSGSIICFTPQDLGLSETEASGLLGNYTLSVQVDVQNISSLGMSMELVIIVSEEGCLNINRDSLQFDTQIGVLQSSDVLSSGTLDRDSYRHIKQLASGGSIFSSTSNFIKKYGPAVKSGIKTALPYAQKALEVAPLLLGLGEREDMEGKGKRKKKPLKSRLMY